MRQKVIE